MSASLETSSQSQVPIIRAPATARHLPGEAGIWFLVCGDLMIFSLLFGAFLVSRSDAPALFSQSQAMLDSGLATFNTCLLLTSSWLVAGAVRSFKAARVDSSARMLRATIACGVLFAHVKIFEYVMKISSGVGPSYNDFFTLYYVITGMHLVHVAIGIGLLFWISGRVRTRGYSGTEVPLIEVGATFWHFVDVVWIIIFPLLYLAS